jgi:hypothetical protein
MAVLTMRTRRQPVATHGNGFRAFEPFLGAPPLATDCHRLRPLCSISAPYDVVYKGNTQQDAGVPRPLVNESGPRAWRRRSRLSSENFRD